MDQKRVDLTVCQDCKVNPATYGDGLTWARCSSCQLKSTQGKIEPSFAPRGALVGEGEKFEHKLIKGKTSIIIPVYMSNYTLFHYTGNCIGSIREHTDKQVTPYEIVIVDNGSPIQPPNLNAYYADKVVKLTENLGVTKAWNKGIRVSFGEYIVLLNNDTQVFEGWLEGLKAELDNGADLVMAHPMYSLTEPFARAVESKKVLEGKSIFDKLERDFSCVMFKKELINEVGAFDERFFNYCQDVDFFKRMDQLGKKYKMIDRVTIHHVSDATGYALANKSAPDQLRQYLEEKGTTPKIMEEDKEKFEEKWSSTEDKKGGENMDQFTTEQLEAELQKRKNPPVEEKAQVPNADSKFVRCKDSGDKIYFRKDKKLHWIKNPETLEILGGHFGDEYTLSKEEFNSYERGEPLDTFNVERYK